jgi:CheY-like chemotaxis protein
VRVAPTRASVLADPDYLQSILRNFVSNARRYARQGGILIGARRRGARVRIEVWDTGPGVPADKQAELFQEFHRLQDTDNLGVRGAGLGLAVVKRMAHLMGAQIGFRSVEGRGSVFYVVVPAAEAPGAAPPVGHPHAAPAAADRLDLAGMHVLAVDDEPAVLEGMQALLTSWGCVAHVARTAEEAIAIGGRVALDAAIADLQLAGSKTGLDVIAAVRPAMADPAAVALLTAEAGASLDDAARAAGVQLLAKPADAELVRRFLAAARRGRAQAAE